MSYCLSRITLTILCIILLYGCGDIGPIQPEQTIETTIEATIASKVGTKQISFVLPEVNVLSNDNRHNINSFHLRVWSIDPACGKSKDLSQVSSFRNRQEIKAYVDINCTYQASLALGYVAASSPFGENASYGASVQSLVQLHCVSCHSPGGRRAKTDLTAESNIQAMKATIQARVANGSMPPNKSLSLADKQVFADWLVSPVTNGNAASSDLDEVILEPTSDVIFKVTPDMQKQNIIIQFNY